jgi:glutamate/tyrosine decarboxylase-like PLP-dependent enzyme
MLSEYSTLQLSKSLMYCKVVSINVSGHKYGLVYPGVGWAIWRDPKYLPKGITITTKSSFHPLHS